MKRSDLTLPEVGLIAGTRGMLGAGIALLLADKLSEDQRRVMGWTLLQKGAVVRGHSAGGTARGRDSVVRR